MICTLHNISLRVIKFRKMGLTEHVARMGAMRNAYKVLGRKPEDMMPFGR
jgi:hypothetical protein